ncbi:MAG: 3-keto-5-aminohexanoate cleavage protein, partial [Humidesulfovibrio sp.]|nr:3-keto-5-aminohexanoate cleavage protein [Humidesulfovibrio sp.]
ILHVHARDAEGRPTHDAGLYAPIVAGIRSARPEAIVCVSTSGRNGATLSERAAVLDLDGAARPDMASLTLGSFNFRREASVNDPDTILALARKMSERGIKPELEVFDTGMAATLKYLERKGELTGRLYANVILGGVNTAQATMADLCHLVSQLPETAFWAAGGVGGAQLPMNIAALLMGGHVRLGLEDAIWFDRSRTTPARNVELVHRVCEIAARLELRPATCAEARSLLGLI